MNVDSHIEILIRPGGEYLPEKRLWNGCPSAQKTVKRLWATLFTGGRFEPSRKNHCVVMYSDDNGETWVDPYMVIRGNEAEGYRTMDTNFWLDPQGKLWITWNRMRFPPDIAEPDYSATNEWLMQFFDDDLETWQICCENPEADEPVWSAPRRLFPGILRNRPTVLSNGEWAFPVFFAAEENAEFSTYFVTCDCGKTFERRQGPRRICGCPFDEPMIVETEPGKLIFAARTMEKYIAFAHSEDYGATWTDLTLTGIPNPSARLPLRKLMSGRLLLINTPVPIIGDRTGLIAFLSEDGSKTWKYHLRLDDRRSTSYPDGGEDENGYFWMAYDVQRDNRQETSPGDPTHSDAAKEIILACFCEEDVIASRFVSPASI